jgi:hypothetical protein
MCAASNRLSDGGAPSASLAADGPRNARSSGMTLRQRSPRRNAVRQELRTMVSS